MREPTINTTSGRTARLDLTHGMACRGATACRRSVPKCPAMTQEHHRRRRVFRIFRETLLVAAVQARRLPLARDRNAPHKHVWRAEIVLLSADGVGTNEIMRQTGKSKTCVWRWQERFMQEGYGGLLRGKTRPSRIPPLGPDIAERVVMLTQTGRSGRDQAGLNGSPLRDPTGRLRTRPPCLRTVILSQHRGYCR